MLLHRDVDRTHSRSVAIGLFKRMDTNNSGSLSYTEIECRLHDLGIPERKRDLIIAMIDSDHDHQVSLREFALGFGRFQAAVSYVSHPRLCELRQLSQSLQSLLSDNLCSGFSSLDRRLTIHPWLPGAGNAATKSRNNLPPQSSVLSRHVIAERSIGSSVCLLLRSQERR